MTQSRYSATIDTASLNTVQRLRILSQAMATFREFQAAGEEAPASTAEMNAVDLKTERIIASMSQKTAGMTPAGIAGITRSLETAIDHYAQTHAGNRLHISGSSPEKVTDAAKAIYSVAGAENARDARLLVLHTQQRIDALIERAARSAARVMREEVHSGLTRNR